MLERVVGRLVLGGMMRVGVGVGLRQRSQALSSAQRVLCVGHFVRGSRLLSHS
jgi:hypothetical protein